MWFQQFQVATSALCNSENPPLGLKSNLQSFQTPRSKAGNIIVIFTFSLAASQFQDKLKESQWDFCVCVDCIVLFSCGIGNLSLPAWRCRGLFHRLFVTFMLVGKMDYCRETRAVETWEQVTEPGVLCAPLSFCATKAPHYCRSLTLHCAHSPWTGRKMTVGCGILGQPQKPTDALWAHWEDLSWSHQI